MEHEDRQPYACWVFMWEEGLGVGVGVLRQELLFNLVSVSSGLRTTLDQSWRTCNGQLAIIW